MEKDYERVQKEKHMLELMLKSNRKVEHIHKSESENVNDLLELANEELERNSKKITEVTIILKFS